MKNVDIKTMNYSEFVGYVRERNRPSGGIKTVHEVAVNAFVKSSNKVLEIGSNTGFTSINLHLLTGCQVAGVDVNESSLAEARRSAQANGIDQSVQFVHSDARNLPFEDGIFDLVWCSNVTSFISDKEGAIKEYLRVLKQGGFLVAVPIYYVTEAPASLVNKVSDAIGTEINVRKKEDWQRLFVEVAANAQANLVEVFVSDHVYVDRSGFIDEYTNMIMNKGHLSGLADEERTKLREKASYFYNLFNENLKYAGFSTMIYQKRGEAEELELYLTK